jgi:hypothetical protein
MEETAEVRKEYQWLNGISQGYNGSSEKMMKEITRTLRQ